MAACETCRWTTQDSEHSFDCASPVRQFGGCGQHPVAGQGRAEAEERTLAAVRRRPMMIPAPMRAEKRAEPAAPRSRLTGSRLMEAALRSWVAAVAAAVLLAGCGSAPDPGAGSAAPTPGLSAHSPTRQPCSAPASRSVITLTDTLPWPVVTVPVGAHVVVTVPRWHSGTATAVADAGGGILREQCTVLLPGGGRRTIFAAVRPGSIHLGATVEPASNLMMPAWRGEVVVRAAGTSHLATAPRRAVLTA